MNHISIEDCAQDALHSLDPNIKFKAESDFKDIVRDLQVQDYHIVLQNYSQNVAFVFLLLLSKQLPRNAEIIQIFMNLQNIAQEWMLPNGEFRRRSDPGHLPFHIVNTLGNALGICMRRIYIVQKSKNDLVFFFKDYAHPKPLLKLFLYNHFIEVVSTIDNEIEYVRYKVMVNSFQEKIIPIILKDLYPYFISVTDKIKINELSAMLPTLRENTLVQKFDLFSPEDKMVSQLVFNLLKEIVSFKYNITFSQYDFESESQYFMITFPQSILSILSSREFLEAFYFMLEKMVSLDYTGNNCDTSFECLKKILLSRFTTLNKEQKAELVHLHYAGLYKLIRANIISQKTLEKVFECVDKFIHNFGLTELEKNHQNHIEFSAAVKQKTMMVLNGSQLSCDNNLLSIASQVVCKIASESIEMSQQKYIQFYKDFCKELFFTFFQAYIDKDHMILGKSNVQKIRGLGQMLTDFFRYINSVGTMDIGFMFQIVLSRCNDVFMSENPKKIANFIFLITQMAEEDFFQRNIIFESTPNQKLFNLGHLIRNCFDFIEKYKSNPIKDKLIDVAILLFLQKILHECLNNLGNGEQEIVITSKTYQVINMSTSISISDENFLMFCFEELLQCLNTNDCEKVEYILQVLHENLIKLKHTLRRESFVDTIISKRVLQKTIELSRNSLQESFELLKERRKLYKIITILSFDDLLDLYRPNIDYVVEQLACDFIEKRYEKIVFDMSGICQNIEASSIYRYFLNRINASIGLQLLIKTLYQNFGNNASMIEEVVSLNLALLSDRSLRMSQKQMSLLIYEITDDTLQYLCQMLGEIRASQFSDLLKSVFELSNLIFEASYINLFLIKRKSPEKLIAFFQTLIDNILANYYWAHEYPDLSETIHNTVELFFSSASEIIITSLWTNDTQHKQVEVINKFIQFIQFTMNLCRHTLESAVLSGKNYQLSQKLLETISKLFSFMRYKRNSLHRDNVVQVIEGIRVQNQLTSVNLLEGLYKVSMTNIKNISNALNTICICIMELTFFYPEVYKTIFVSLGVSEDGIRKIERIYKNLHNVKDDPLFVSNLKQWLSKSENHYDLDIDY